MIKSSMRAAAFAGLGTAFGAGALLATDPIPDLPVSRTLASCPVVAPGSQLTFVGIGDAVPTAAGTVASAAGSTVIADSGDYGAYGGGSHYLKVGGASLKITAASGTSITVAGTLPADIAGAAFDVVPCPTLNSILGADNRFGLTGGSNAASADLVLVEIDGTLERYFYNPGLPPLVPAKWESVSNPGTDAGDDPISPNGGIAIDRKAGSAVTLLVAGIAETGNQRIDVRAGLNLLSWPFAAGSTLAESGIETAITGASNAANADLVLIEIDGTIERFFYNPGLPPLVPARWESVSSPGTDAGDTELSGCKSFGIDRLQGGPLSFTALQPLAP